MDTSAGRRKMVAGRDSRLLPPFALTDPVLLTQSEQYRRRPPTSSSSPPPPESEQQQQQQDDSAEWTSVSPDRTPPPPPATCTPSSSSSSSSSSTSPDDQSMASLLKHNYPQADTPLVESGNKSESKTSRKQQQSSPFNISQPQHGSSSIEKKHQRNYVKAKISAHENAMKRNNA